MHGNRVSLPILLAGLVALAGPAAAQSATAQADAQASASADLAAAREKLEQKAEQVSTRAQEKADAKLEAAAKKIDEAAARAESKVAGRLAGELDVEAKVLLEQKAELGASWGELMIAHSLEQNAAAEWSVEQLVTLHHSGMGWGRIAAGLGFELGSAVRAIDAEARVATGQARADGRVGVMAGGSGAARVDAGAGAGL
ncbi:MAG: hypothetical protein ABIP29_12040, partial [Candidatus Eisenbacteria bacterium]